MTKKFFIPPPEKTHELSADPAGPPLKTVLIVEDEKLFSEMLRAFLESQQFRVEEASTGGDAVRRMLARDFDFILCDMVMPEFPGEMFYRAVERAKPHLCPRFIFMTGHRGNKKVDEFIRSVGGLMLWKPFEVHVLMEAIQSVGSKTQRSGGR